MRKTWNFSGVQDKHHAIFSQNSNRLITVDNNYFLTAMPFAKLSKINFTQAGVYLTECGNGRVFEKLTDWMGGYRTKSICMSNFSEALFPTDRNGQDEVKVQKVNDYFILCIQEINQSIFQIKKRIEVWNSKYSLRKI